MNDVLPDQSPLWEFFEDAVREVFRQYGYRNIRTPIVERTELFVRGVGELTDIVEKEMYSFSDAMNGDNLSLRPEGTAPTVRAVLEHNLLYNGLQRLCIAARRSAMSGQEDVTAHTFGAEALGSPALTSTSNCWSWRTACGRSSASRKCRRSIPSAVPQNDTRSAPI
jgi:histidyl-tRNA synthetase